MSNLFQIIENLINCKSITPNDGGSIEYISNILEKLGFKCKIFRFEEVVNLYAKLESGKKNICFAGHVDVVPPGNESLWKNDPFKMTIKENKIYGRGIVDMKGSIGCFISAVQKFLQKNKKQNFSISFLITSDEEGIAKNGTNKLLEEIEKINEKIDFCLIGEMTSKKKPCDCIKNGRRGSLNFELEVFGIQGHVAYPQEIDNPVHRITRILNDLININLDKGNEFFEKSGLQVTNTYSDSSAVNVCGSKAIAKINVRYNNNFNPQKLSDTITEVCLKHCNKNQFLLKYPDWNASYYLSKKSDITGIVSESIYEVCGYKPIIDTSGGATDGRFIAKYCDNIIELGFLEETAHKINESATIEEVEILESVYLKILEKINNHQF